MRENAIRDVPFRVDTHRFGSPAIINVPRECRQFHRQHHLRASDLNRFVAELKNSPDNMAAGHWVSMWYSNLGEQHSLHS